MVSLLLYPKVSRLDDHGSQKCWASFVCIPPQATCIYIVGNFAPSVLMIEKNLNRFHEEAFYFTQLVQACHIFDHRS